MNFLINLLGLAKPTDDVVGRRGTESETSFQLMKAQKAFTDEGSLHH